MPPLKITTRLNHQVVVPMLQTRCMDRTIAIVALLVGVVSAVAAIGSWTSTRRGNNQGAKTLELTASLTGIEQERRREELTPQFEITCKQTAEDRAMLHITLTGPDGLAHLDEVTVTIRNDTHTRGESQIAGGQSTAEIRQVVWGPYRLVPGVDEADANGRTVVVAGKLFRGDWFPLALERTMPPSWWSDGARWRQEWSGKPVRLLLTCRQGDTRWDVPMEVGVKPGPATGRVDPTEAKAGADAVYRPKDRLQI